jgi:hypothetical protein
VFLPPAIIIVNVVFLTGRPKNRWWNCLQTDINRCKLRSGKRGQKTELTVRRALRRLWSALDCRAIEEGEDKRK